MSSHMKFLVRNFNKSDIWIIQKLFLSSGLKCDPTYIRIQMFSRLFLNRTLCYCFIQNINNWPLGARSSRQFFSKLSIFDPSHKNINRKQLTWKCKRKVLRGFIYNPSHQQAAIISTKLQQNNSKNEHMHAKKMKIMECVDLPTVERLYEKYKQISQNNCYANFGTKDWKKRTHNKLYTFGALSFVQRKSYSSQKIQP